MTALRRLWAWLTGEATTRCAYCGAVLHHPPDGGAGSVCPDCERNE